jgi:hypothetical protein
MMMRAMMRILPNGGRHDFGSEVDLGESVKSTY